MDLIRTILLQIEEKHDGGFGWVDLSEAHEDHLVLYEHCRLAAEAGLIEGEDVSSHSGRRFSTGRMTWWGHDFLDTVRDPEIWSKTKIGATAAGGFSLEILSELAKGFIKTKIKEHTGIEI